MENNMIGQRIKIRRKELHLTQKDIYDATKITGGNLSEIENGKYLPTSSTLIALSKILECSIDWILTGNNWISEVQISEVLPSESDTRILSKIQLLNDKDKNEIENFIDYKLATSNKMGLSSTLINGEANIDDDTVIA